MIRLTCRAGLFFMAAQMLLGTPVHAQISDDAVRIGLLTDFSSIYSSATGKGSEEAVKLAIEEVKARAGGAEVILVTGDCQLKADIAAGIARRWIDNEKIDLIVGGCNSAAGIAVQEVARNRNVLTLWSEVGVPDVTGKSCSRTSAQWTFDTYMLARSVIAGLNENREDKWFFVTADYSFGHALQKDAEAALKQSGGSVVGSVRHPLNNPDFSSFLLQAQASGAQIVGFANAAADLSNGIKQAKEFGLSPPKIKLAGFLVLLTDLHALGLDVAQGLISPTSFYWNRDEQTREWSKRFFERTKQMPTMMQAGVYSAVKNYLRAVNEVKSDAADAVMTQLRAHPINDMMVRNGTLREDGRLVYDQLLMQAKTPAESKEPWDYQRVIRVLPAKEVYRSIEESGCSVVEVKR
jgi:branched-chain amino acid transport system substrate-binding protein